MASRKSSRASSAPRAPRVMARFVPRLPLPDPLAPPPPLDMGGSGVAGGAAWGTVDSGAGVEVGVGAGSSAWGIGVGVGPSPWRAG